MTRSHRVRTCLLSLAVAGAAAAPPAGPPAPAPVVPPPDYSGLTQSVRVPFSNRVDFEKLASMDVRVSINGGPALSVEVDTGSVGLIVGANQVPGIDRNAPPGHMNYSSSGVELDGVWTPATVTFLDAKGPDGRPVQARLPVLAAERTVIHPGAVNGRAAKPRPAAKPTAGKPRVPVVHMLGIGFGRGEDAHPERKRVPEPGRHAGRHHAEGVHDRPGRHPPGPDAGRRRRRVFVREAGRAAGVARVGRGCGPASRTGPPPRARSRSAPPSRSGPAS